VEISVINTKQIKLINSLKDYDSHPHWSPNDTNFTNNMQLPIHRWFRFPAGFSADWVKNTIKWHQEQKSLKDMDSYTVLDPFAGSGTSVLAAESIGVKSFGIEAHPSLYKIGKIKLSEKDKIPKGKYLNPRISHDGLNWYLTISVELDNNFKYLLTDESLGIDVGVKDLAILSNGKKYKNINKQTKIKSLEKKVKRLQRKASKKYENNKQGKKYIKTKNIEKLEVAMRKIYKRLTNIRTDYIQKVTTEIVKTKPSRIVMETLDINGMMKNKSLSKAIQDQKLYKFKVILHQKSEKYGIEFIQADRWYPSSKTCSECGYKKPKLSLGEREFICENCGSIIDRDLNAAMNLSRYEIV
jgi:putative transposase